MIECAESSAALTPQSQKANFQKVTLIILNFKMERFTKKLRFFMILAELTQDFQGFEVISRQFF